MAHIKSYLFGLFATAMFALAALGHLPKEWLAIMLLILLFSVFLREKLKYIVGTFTVLVLLFVVRGNSDAYNYYFEILIVTVGVGLAVDYIESVLIRPSGTSRE